MLYILPLTSSTFFRILLENNSGFRRLPFWGSFFCTERRCNILKKVYILPTVLLTSLLSANPAFAQTAGGVTQVQTFIQSVIQVMITLAGLVSAGFFVWGGFGYITSSGNPESLDRSKRTIFFSAIGLTIVLGAFVLTNIVTQLATAAFGAGH